MIVLVSIVTVLSAFVKNIGALAIMMPIAFQMARRSNVSPSMFLMPMAFGSLLGGLMTQIGTSPNIIVSGIRQELTGTPFTMFDFTPVGAVLALMGVIFLAIAYRLLPARRREEQGMDRAIEIKNYTTEAHVLADTAAVGKKVGNSIAPPMARPWSPPSSAPRASAARPSPMRRCGPATFSSSRGTRRRSTRWSASPGSPSPTAGDGGRESADIGVIEAIIGESSGLIGASAAELTLFDRTGLNLLAISRRDQRFTERLGQIKFRNGDVILLQGHLQRIPELLREWDCLPLVERGLKLGSVRNGLIPC